MCIRDRNGAAPKIEAQITYFLPTRSPTGPPINVPIAVATKNMNKYSCDYCTDVYKRQVYDVVSSFGSCFKGKNGANVQRCFG